MTNFCLLILGLAGGITVGAGIFAFFTALGLVTRIIDIGKTRKYSSIYKISILIGSLVSTYLYMFEFKTGIHKGWSIIIGLFMGIFIGMVASTLAEILGVIPFLSYRLGINKWIYIMIIAVILGKIIGSIVYWVSPGFT